MFSKFYANKSSGPTCPALFGDKHGTWIRALQSSQAVNVTSNEFHVREEDLNIVLHFTSSKTRNYFTA